MDQAYLFNTGNDYHSYNLLGSRPIAGDSSASGFRFAVWAPKAQSVSVIGDFNAWDAAASPMNRIGETGIWTC